MCALAGLTTLVIALLIIPIFPIYAEGDIPGYPTPIYAFEFSRTEADLLAVFGHSTDAGWARRLDMMDQGNHWDFFFMTAYTVLVPSSDGRPTRPVCEADWLLSSWH